MQAVLLLALLGAPELVLPLQIHLMTDLEMVHPTTGTSMRVNISEAEVQSQILPEVNRIWAPAGIQFQLAKTIIHTSYPSNAQAHTQAIVITGRDANGQSDPARKTHLFALMQKPNPEKLPLHVYIFPFIGNTSQGNAMKDFGYRVAVGAWSNKHNSSKQRWGPPEPALLTEPHHHFVRGSLARTIAHELGHVLGLRHKRCSSNCLMDSGKKKAGYGLTKKQTKRARKRARKRLR